MLIRASGPLYDNFYLLALGHACHYLLGNSKELALIDPGPTSHVPMLLKRIESLSLPARSISHVFMTHLHADRMAGIPLLRRQFPKVQVYGSAAMRAKLSQREFLQSLYDDDCTLSAAFLPDGSAHPLSCDEFCQLLSIDRVLTESELIRLASGIHIRSVAAPGHTEESLAFQVLPASYLIADEGFGYYRGRELAAPGGDFDQARALTSIDKLSKTEIAGLCLPYQGVLTGLLARKHLESIVQNTKDLFSECARAHELGVSDEEIMNSVREGFYVSELGDPLLQANLKRTFDAIWKQIIARRVPILTS